MDAGNRSNLARGSIYVEYKRKMTILTCILVMVSNEPLDWRL